MNKIIDYRLTPLPLPTSNVDTDDYKFIQVDVQSSEHAEPLVDVAHFGVRSASFYAQKDGLNAPLYAAFGSAMRRVYVRVSVARKLREVNKLLARYGVALVVIDGFRPISVQAELWKWMLECAIAKLPLASHDEHRAYALRYASDPATFVEGDPNTWPTHSTGGAVDVVLEEGASGKRCYMGGIYLDSSDVSSTRYYEIGEGSDSSSFTEAQRNRRLLFWAMVSVGFVNYPFEWWHFDYLTQASVMNLGMPSGLKARYGLANAGRSPELQSA